MSSLQDLPPEILRRVCEYAVPHGLKLSFKQDGTKDNGSDKLFEAVYTAGILPQVSKSIAAEARAIFFSTNTFVITIDSKAHEPVSLKSPLIFGPCGSPHRLHLLRDLRQLELDVIVDKSDSWAYRRQYARVQHFVDILRRHGDDKDKQSLLKRLHVNFRPEQHRRNQTWSWWITNRGIFALEPLAALTGIKEVSITSQWRIGWFTQCLCLRVRGEGGELKELEWPMKTVKRLKPKDQLKRPGKDSVSTWKPGRPMLDWLEFAQRNGIEVPAGTSIDYRKAYVGGQ